jgi:hypothetical protein
MLSTIARLLRPSFCPLTVLLLALAAGCGGNAKKPGPTAAELAEYQARTDRVKAWEDAVRDKTGEHHTLLTRATTDLKKELEAAIRAVPADDEAKSRALKEELHAFAGDDDVLPTNPATLEAAKRYVNDRLTAERAILAALDDLKSRQPKEDARRPVDMHVVRRLEEVSQEAKGGIARMTQAVETLAAVDPTAVWPAVAVAESVTPPPIVAPPTTPLPPSTDPPSTTVARTDRRPDVPPVAEPVEPVAPTPADPAPNPPVRPAKSFLGPPPAGWSVSVDPGPRSEPVPPQLSYRLPVTPSSVIYPAGVPRFAAVGEGSGWIESITVYDLHTGEALGTAGGFRARIVPARNAGPALSADGTLFAINNSTAEGVVVGNVRTKKPVAVLKYPEGEAAILFPANDRLVAVRDQAPARLWSLPGGELLRTFPVAEDVSPDSGTIVCSPGGRFLVVGIGGSPPEAAVFYDLTTGQEVGRLAPPPTSPTETIIKGMAFSPDGTEFAMFVFGMRTGAFSIGEGMQVWDVETGRLVYARPFDKAGEGQLVSVSAKPVQWFPDAKGWLLLQRHVVDRETARLVGRIESEGDTFSHQATTLLDDTRALRTFGGSILAPVEVQRTAR